MLDKVTNSTAQDKTSFANNNGVRSWTSENAKGNAKSSAGHQKEKFQPLFADKKTETAGQLANAQGAAQAAGSGSSSSGGGLDIIA